MTEEKTFFSDNRINVTASQITMGNTLYSLRNVSSVRLGSIEPSKSMEIILMIIGLIIFLMGACASFSKDLRGGGIFTLILGLALGALGIYLMSKKKTTYSILIGTNAGEQKLLWAEDKQYIEKIVAAISESIVEYGKRNF